MKKISITQLRRYGVGVFVVVAGLLFVNTVQQDRLLKSFQHPSTRTPYTTSEPGVHLTESPDNDFTWSRYCIKGSPCVALLSASHHGGISALIDPRTLKKIDQSQSAKAQTATDALSNRVLMREALCAIYKCDVIVDYNDYHKNQSMWLSDHGKHKVGPMPPHWKKVAALQKWLPHFDAVLLMDMDTVWVDFNTSVYDLYDATLTLMSPKTPAFALFKKHEISRCIVDSWWFHGTSPGCRYFKYPDNHRGQTQNLDMPWFWYSMLKCSEIYGGGETYECLNPCNGPVNYVNHLMKDSNHKNLSKLWIRDCFDNKLPEIKQHTKLVVDPMFREKSLMRNMQWGNDRNFTESLKSSITVHHKDHEVMVNWLNKTAGIVQSAGCSQSSCRHANVQLLREKLSDWRSHADEQWQLP